MNGRVCVVTGASSGIGRATARALARLGATLALVGRDRGRGEETVAALRAESGSAAVALFLADLSSQAEIRRLGAELCDRYPAIHVLVNNAGVVNLRRSTTADGIETVFAVNHLAYFLLTHLLLARLRASAPARIVNVASDAHRFGRIDLDDLGHARRYRAMRVYGASKLANILFTYELARRLDGTGVTANCLHPGAVATRLGQNNGRKSCPVTSVHLPRGGRRERQVLRRLPRGALLARIVRREPGPPSLGRERPPERHRIGRSRPLRHLSCAAAPCAAGRRQRLSVPTQIESQEVNPQSISKPVEALRVTVPSFCATRTRATVQPESRKLPKTWKPMEVALPWRMTPGRLPTVTLRAVPLCETWKVSVSPVLEPQVSAARPPTKVQSPP